MSACLINGVCLKAGHRVVDRGTRRRRPTMVLAWLAHTLSSS